MLRLLMIPMVDHKLRKNLLPNVFISLHQNPTRIPPTSPVS